MAELTLHSRLKGFQLIEHLFEVRETTIGGICRFESAPPFLGIEAMAQLAALHVRHLIHFKRHAFLLKVIGCDWPVVAHLQGRFDFKAELFSQSSNAFSYGVKARWPHQEKENLKAELLIGTQPYDDQFQKEFLKDHYQNRFNRLCRTGNPKP